MNRSCFRLCLISLAAIVVFLFGTSSHGIAQEATSTLSGSRSWCRWKADHWISDSNSAI